jgi:hypothetical protein
VAGQFGAASLAGELSADADLDLSERPDVDAEAAHASLRVLASVEQGHRLRDDARQLGFALNPQFNGELIIAGDKERKVTDALALLVAGPMKPELQKLQDRHDAWLEAQQKKKKPAGAALAAYVDKSVPNLSSIVALAKCGGKTILLTGDARGDKILEGLEAVGALARGGKLHVDVLKVPHHGSSNNVDDDFYQRISADHYVFSGDGEHGNPERETYPLAEIDAARKAEWIKQQAIEKKKEAAGGPKARENWSAAKHGLVSFFKDTPLAAGQKLRIVGDNEAHVIDLLDPLGF